MRIKTYALLISGIFLVMLIPSASALEGVSYPGGGKWRPIQDQATWNGLENGLPGPAPRAVGNSYPQQGTQSYRFRSPSRYQGQDDRAMTYQMPETGSAQSVLSDHGYRQPSANPGQSYWRPAPPTSYAGFPGNGVDNQYRFRPMDREQRRVAPLRWSYRPAQIEIPNHYVYRPLQVKHHRRSPGQQRFRPPVAPGMHDYGFKPRDPVYSGYSPSWAPYPGFMLPSYGFHRYEDRPNGRLIRQPMASRYPHTRGYSTPRYTAQMPVGGYRFRPLKQSRWDGYRYYGRRDSYAANPYAAPDHLRRTPGWGDQYGIQPGWYPPMTLPYPGIQQAGRGDAHTRYGVNWYDGRPDGEGAWYKLAGQQEWPRVSQYSPLD